MAAVTTDSEAGPAHGDRVDVSIIIPVYDRWELLAHCLEALQAQEYDGRVVVSIALPVACTAAAGRVVHTMTAVVGDGVLWIALGSQLLAGALL